MSKTEKRHRDSYACTGYAMCASNMADDERSEKQMNMSKRNNKKKTGSRRKSRYVALQKKRMQVPGARENLNTTTTDTQKAL